MKSPAGPIYGPIFVGVFADLMLFGIVINQIHWYYANFTRDPTWIKVYIALLLVVSTTNSVINVLPVYTVLIHHFGDIPRLATAFWASIAAPTLEASITCSVQLFLSWRINILFSKTWLMPIVTLLSVCQFLGSIGTTIAMHRIPEFARFHEFKPVMLAWLGFDAVASVVISGLLVFYVLKNKSGRSKPAGQIFRVIVPTGLITAILSIVQLLLICFSKQGARMFFSLAIPNLYIISLMASVNSRQGWKFSRDSQIDLSNLSSIQLPVRDRPRGSNVKVYNSAPDAMPMKPIRFSISKDAKIEHRDDKPTAI